MSHIFRSGIVIGEQDPREQPARLHLVVLVLRLRLSLRVHRRCRTMSRLKFIGQLSEVKEHAVKRMRRTVPRRDRIQAC